LAKPINTSDELIDTLVLSEEQWRKLSEKLAEVDSSHTGQRQHPRVSYRKLAQIAVAIQLPDGQWAKYIVRSRNLSSGGIGFIHGAYVHTDSRCRIIIKNLHGRVVCLEGVVRHCQYLCGTAHDVGVQFDTPIELTDYTEVSPETISVNSGTKAPTAPPATA
jgi:hypothetical protein